MDFVVVGFGLGAVLMLAGFALRDLGPWLFGSVDDAIALPEFETVKTTIRKQTLAAIGNAISAAGGGVAIVTFAALLARIEDDLGAIVVGMSLALAAVGVGAWTYDAIRRFRAAMDVVSAQEVAVRKRIRPAGYPPNAPAVRPAPLAPEPDDDPIDLDAGDSDALLEIIEEDESAAEPDDQAADEAEAEPSSTVTHDDFEDAPLLPEPEPESFAAELPELEPDPLYSDHGAEIVDDAFESSLAARWRASGQAGSPPEEPPQPETADALPNAARDPDSRFVDLPPLPEEPVDSLIDEAVRFDYRAEPPRQVPSWLFDDLETDLTAPGTPGPIDPVDQFHDARPVQRTSALERLLAEEDENDGSENDAGEAVKKRPGSRFRLRDST